MEEYRKNEILLEEIKQKILICGRSVDSDLTGETGIESVPPSKRCGTLLEMGHKI